jgi:hypothetical protein
LKNEFFVVLYYRKRPFDAIGESFSEELRCPNSSIELE